MPLPYEFIKFGAIYGPEPYEFIGFGAIYGPKPYEFIGFGAIYGPKPYKYIGFGVHFARQVTPGRGPNKSVEPPGPASEDPSQDAHNDTLLGCAKSLIKTPLKPC